MSRKSPKVATNVVSLRPQVVASQQLSLLPIDIDACVSSPLGSADLKNIVRGRDGHYYALKSTEQHPLLPATEFLCYKLAAACGVPTPLGSLVRTQERSVLFGSRWESSMPTTSPLAQVELYEACSEALSSMLAFDVFVGNEDRHRKNFLFRRTFEDRVALVAIDFSRALLIRGFPTDSFPVAVDSNTRTTINFLKRANLWRGPSATFTVDALRLVTADHLEHWLKEMPEYWLPKTISDDLLTWWGTDGFRRRINKTFELL